MKVLITGGTGFVGAHVVAEVLKAGHQVRLLARAPARIAPALAPLGVTVEDVARGDITDEASIERALAGCDALIHAASVYSLDPRKAETIRQTNVRGTELVLGAAHRAGLDPIIYVSSYVALLPAKGASVSESDEVGDPPTPYARSKADAERVARRFQEQGAPVVCTYPGAVYGPHDPYFGEGAHLVAGILKQRQIFTIRGGFPIADVGWVARAHAAMLQKGRGPRRYLLGGHYTELTEVFAMLRALTGRRLPALWTPAPIARLTARLTDWLQRLVPVRLPVNYEGTWITLHGARPDDSKVRTELGLEPPPLQETFAALVRWLASTGHLQPKHAPKVLAAGTAEAPREAA